MPEHLLRRTFLEELKARGYRVVAIEVPGYNESRNECYRTKIDELVTAPFRERARHVEEALEDTRERFDRAISFVDSYYDVVFVCSPLSDIAFHMAVKPDLNTRVWLRDIHYSLYQEVEELLNLTEERGFAILIVSDHGFDLKNYYHSDYGFWSLNIEPPSWWSISTILDFKENMLKLVKGV
jgi:hypothetical protein